MVRDFLFFIRALWREWAVLLTGGSIVALLALFTLSTGRTVPQSINWLVIGITLMLAAFLSWRVEWIKAGQGLVDLDFKEIQAIFKGRTEPQIKPLLRRYMGKWTTISGMLFWSLSRSSANCRT